MAPADAHDQAQPFFCEVRDVPSGFRTRRREVAVPARPQGTAVGL